MKTSSNKNGPDWRDIAAQYDGWFDQEPGKSAFHLESSLLIGALGLSQGKSVLDVGCGTGRFLLKLLALGAEARGIDSAAEMLELAKQKGLKERVSLARAEELPFSDGAFDFTVFFTSLEFVDDPVKAMSEAARVTRKRLVIGFINRRSLIGMNYRRAAKSGDSIYSRASFFTGGDIRRIALSAGVGGSPEFRYTLFSPLGFHAVAMLLERLLMGSGIPLGGFGIAIFNLGR